MHSQPTKFLKTFTGCFDRIRLDFTPDGPPLTAEERSRTSANYPTSLAFLHIRLNGKDAAELLPSGYLLLILDHLLGKFSGLTGGQVITAEWFSDPWQFDLRGDPAHNRVYITLHVPGHWVAMQDVSVPLDNFGDELIRVAEKWEEYLLRHYQEEMLDPGEWGDQYRRFKRYLQDAHKAIQQYASSSLL